MGGPLHGGGLQRAECNGTFPPNSITFTRSRGISSSIVCCHYTVHGVLEMQRMDRISISFVKRDDSRRSPVQFMVVIGEERPLALQQKISLNHATITDDGYKCCAIGLVESLGCNIEFQRIEATAN